MSEKPSCPRCFISLVTTNQYSLKEGRSLITTVTNDYRTG